MIYCLPEATPLIFARYSRYFYNFCVGLLTHEQEKIKHLENAALYGSYKHTFFHINKHTHTHTHTCVGRGSCVCGVPPECACDALAPVSQEPYFGPTCECNPDICFNANWTSDGRKVSGVRILIHCLGLCERQLIWFVGLSKWFWL